MLDSSRLRNPELFKKIVDPEKAALLIEDGMNVGVSGFTPSGYPKKTRWLWPGLSVRARSAGSIFGAVLRSVPKSRKNWQRSMVSRVACRIMLIPTEA